MDRGRQGHLSLKGFGGNEHGTFRDRPTSVVGEVDVGRRSGGISLAGYPADDPYAVLNRLRGSRNHGRSHEKGRVLIQFHVASCPLAF